MVTHPFSKFYNYYSKDRLFWIFGLGYWSFKFIGAYHVRFPLQLLHILWYIRYENLVLTKTTIFAEYPHYLFTGLSMDYWIVAAFRSPLMKALDRSVETLGLWIVTSSVTFIKLANQSSIKLCPIVHLVAVWTLIYFVGRSYLSIASGS